MEKNKEFTGTEIKMTVGWRDELPTTVTYSSPYPDETIENIIHGFVTCMVGHTWHIDTVLEAMRDYVDEHMPLDDEEEVEDEDQED